MQGQRVHEPGWGKGGEKWWWRVGGCLLAPPWNSSLERLFTTSPLWSPWVHWPGGEGASPRQENGAGKRQWGTCWWPPELQDLTSLLSLLKYSFSLHFNMQRFEKPQHHCKHLKKRNRQLTRGPSFPAAACKHRLDSSQRVVLSAASVSDSFRERKRKRFELLSLKCFFCFLFFAVQARV